MPAPAHDRMTGRERVLAALTHQIPDRVPLDFGGSLSGIHELAYDGLVDHLGLRGRIGPVRTLDAVQRLAAPDEAVLDRLHIDTRYLPVRAVGQGSCQVREVAGDARACLESDDEFGVRWSRPADRSLCSIASFHPLADATLEQVRDYPFPEGNEPARFAGLRAYALELSVSTPYAVVTDAAGSLLETCSLLRGQEQWLCDLHANPELCELLLDRALRFWTDWFGGLLDEVGDLLDVITLADDLAGARGPLFSPAVYRRLVKPRHQQLVQSIKARTRTPINFHTCGACLEYIPDLLAIGVDALSPPVSDSEGYCMWPPALKGRFGDRLCFWGGTIERADGSVPDAPSAMGLRLADEIRAWMLGGGYVFSVASNVQPGVSPGSLVALYDSAYELGSYGADGAI